MIKKILTFTAVIFAAFFVMVISGCVLIMVLADPIITAHGVMDGQ